MEDETKMREILLGELESKREQLKRLKEDIDDLCAGRITEEDVFCATPTDLERAKGILESQIQKLQEQLGVEDEGTSDEDVSIDTGPESIILRRPPTTHEKFAFFKHKKSEP